MSLVSLQVRRENFYKELRKPERWHNIHKIYCFFRDNPGSSRRDASNALGIAMHTLSSKVTVLISLNLLRDVSTKFCPIAKASVCVVACTEKEF